MDHLQVDFVIWLKNPMSICLPFCTLYEDSDHLQIIFVNLF